jgi:2-polyprenyl-6-methoxyphenol hydroxylase-like FAD-dependent oxidoreductase
MKALIAGAGPGGLTAALCLARVGIECEVFEVVPPSPNPRLICVHLRPKTAFSRRKPFSFPLKQYLFFVDSAPLI